MPRIFLQLIALLAATPILAFSPAPGGPPPGGPPPGGGGAVRNVPEIDLFAGASVLMIAVVVGLLLWEWRRRTLRR